MNPIIEFINVSKHYINVEALENVSLSISKGSIFGVIGKSGAGKSTLARCINSLERIDSGEIRFHGEAINQLSGKDLRQTRQKIGMIFQQFNLFMQKSVIDNVAFPLEIAGVPRKERRRAALKYLELVGIPEKADEYPAKLSGGQKQRCAIARAIVSSPEVLICDEATSALDPETTVGILHLLGNINKELGITMIIITHEMSVVTSICDTVAVMDGGALAEIGPTVDLFKSPKSDAAKSLLNSSDEHLLLAEMNRLGVSTDQVLKAINEIAKPEYEL